VGSSKESPQELFVRALGIEPELAAVLVTNGFTTLEEVAYVPIDELRSIDWGDEQLLQAWRARARRYLLIQEIGEGDDEDPFSALVRKPPAPMPGASGAAIDENEDR